MASRRYALERGGPRRLRVRWGWRLKGFEVALDGQAWTLDRAAVLAGASITLPGGSTLFVQNVRRRWWSVALRDDLRVDLDGAPVPGSDGHPRTIGRRAASVIALFGLLRLFLVAMWVSLASAPDANAISASFTFNLAAVDGAVLLVLAIPAALALRPAVVLAAGLLGVELAVSLLFAGGRASGLGVLIQVLVIVHLVDAWRRMRPRSPSPSLAAVFE
ncbi:MAG TPA: hypothetical protein VFL83_01685 [Anaeromyxobacter sp.]|nr:hypothetical protein [Anaeromyxobacter sp.]